MQHVIDIKVRSDGSKDKTEKESNLNVDRWDIHKKTKALKQKQREIELVNTRYSRNKTNTTKTKRELELINCRLEINDKRTNLIDNNPDDNMMEQAREQQEYQRKPTNSKVLSNVENNSLQRVIDIKKVAMDQWIT